jgi:hypothetical protein
MYAGLVCLHACTFQYPACLSTCPACDAGVGVCIHMQTVELTNNTVLGLTGVGGAISLAERCNSEGACSPVTALLKGLNATGNRAQTAGGALFFSGSNPASGLMLRFVCPCGITAPCKPCFLRED